MEVGIEACLLALPIHLLSHLVVLLWQRFQKGCTASTPPAMRATWYAALPAAAPCSVQSQSARGVSGTITTALRTFTSDQQRGTLCWLENLNLLLRSIAACLFVQNFCQDFLQYSKVIKPQWTDMTSSGGILE